MPITKSAEKAARQNVRRNAENQKGKTALKNALKNYKKLVAGRRFDDARKALADVYQALDKSAKRNLIKKNKASRLKSRLTQLMARASKASS